MSFEILPGLAGIADRYDAFILDLWGVVHNGHAPYPGALECMARMREGGRKVILLSNAPRTNGYVVEFLKTIGVPREAYDLILTSGDMTREILETRGETFLKNGESRFYQIGAARDKGLEDGLDFKRISDMEDAEFIICTGLVNDEVETPENYRLLLEKALAHNLTMICANPDLTVMRGEKSIYCAGSIAALYEEMGGDVILYGKPYLETYKRTIQKLELDGPDRVLAVGDSMRTDIKGARGAGIDSVLIGGGIHAEEWGLASGQAPSPEQIEAVSELHGFSPTFVTAHMVW